MSLTKKISVMTILSAFVLLTACGEQKVEKEVTIKDHVFSPTEIKVPAGQAFVLKVINEDDTPEEFESHELKVEKVIAGGKTGTVHIRALEKGTYPFIGEYNEATAKGVIIAE